MGIVMLHTAFFMCTHWCVCMVKELMVLIQMTLLPQWHKYRGKLHRSNNSRLSNKAIQNWNKLRYPNLT
jgi:hypothetical protein